VCDTADDILCYTGWLNTSFLPNNPEFRLVRVKNLFTEPCPANMTEAEWRFSYKDIKFVVAHRGANGLTEYYEFQFMLKLYYTFKKLEHKTYEMLRKDWILVIKNCNRTREIFTHLYSFLTCESDRKASESYLIRNKMDE